MKKVAEVKLMENLFEYELGILRDFKLNYKTNYGFIRSLCINNLTDNINSYANSIKDYQNFVQLGIGGSALGATSSVEFMGGIYHNYINNKRYFALDNIDSERMDFALSLDTEKTIFHIVSKSGSTIETLSQFFIIYEKLKKTLGEEVNKHFVFTTSKKGFLHDFAMQNNIPIFYIPEDVGGRYSVFTSVGLIALSFLGYNIERFVEGAKTAVRAFRNGWDMPNDFAKFSIGEYKNGKNMLVMFAYKDALYGVADWFRQLWAESLGKNGVGQTPIKALGVTDQHSQLQLYQDGPKDKAILFLDTVSNKDFIVEEPLFLPYLKNRSLSEIMGIEKESTHRALKENGIDCGAIFIKERNEYALGALYISLMIATAKAGELLDINPFDQPGVELGKKYTKEALNR